MLPLSEYGVTDFETLAEAKAAQRDVIDRLRHSSLDPEVYEFLEHCARRCSRPCSAVCWIGQRNRRKALIPATHQLLTQASNGGSIWQVRVGRASWSKAKTDAETISINTIKKFNRWCLDNLAASELVAVGLVNVRRSDPGLREGWICEVNQLVTGAPAERLEQVFTPQPQKYEVGDFCSVVAVGDVGRAISDVLRRDVRQWTHPEEGPDAMADPVPKSWRRKYYEWLLTKRLDEFLVRYGCDRHFNQLCKPPRQKQLKPKKRHPNPVWLRRYQYGYDPEDDPERLP